jgi:RHS repeat-associated protein
VPAPTFTAAPNSPSREYIYSGLPAVAGGALLAKIEGSATKYYHQDHLSNRLVTDSSGTALEQKGHFPFGEDWYQGTDKLKFTTYERDSESGNDYAMARYHVNRLARFSSPDPISGDISDPQSLNRYAYSRNDPINLFDPLGMYCEYRSDDDTFVESIDLDSSPEECSNTGGAWVEGADTAILVLAGGSSGRPSGGTSGGPTGAPTGMGGGSGGGGGGNGGGGSGGGQGGHEPPKAGAANNGFTLGVRAPGQTWTQCMSSTSGTYSINGVLPSSWQNGATSVLAGNDVSQILFGDSSEGSAGLLVWEGSSHSVEAGVGSVMTAGRRTASIMDLNLAGKTGPAARILGKTGAEKLAGFLTGVAEIKMAIDVGLTGAQAIGCAIHR